MSIETEPLLEISWYPVSRNEIQNSSLRNFDRRRFFSGQLQRPGFLFQMPQMFFGLPNFFGKKIGDMATKTFFGDLTFFHLTEVG